MKCVGLISLCRFPFLFVFASVVCLLVVVFCNVFPCTLFCLSGMLCCLIVFFFLLCLALGLFVSVCWSCFLLVLMLLGLVMFFWCLFYCGVSCGLPRVSSALSSLVGGPEPIEIIYQLSDEFEPRRYYTGQTRRPVSTQHSVLSFCPI